MPSRARSTSSSSSARPASSWDAQTSSPRSSVRPSAASEPDAPGRVAVLDLLRARTRRFDTVFVLGLEQGSLPRRPRSEPFLDDDTRRALDDRREARLVRPDAASRDRFLFATACSRPRRRLVLVRQAVGDEGSPREPSPFWESVRELFDADDVRRHTMRRPLSALTRELEAAPTERERLRSLAVAREPESRRGCSAGAGERLEQTTRACDDGVRPSHPADARACATARRGSRRVLGLRARTDGVVLRRLVRRALPAARDDRQGDRPHDARLDPPRGAPALLPTAPERRSRRGPGHAREPRRRDRADARLCLPGGRHRSSDRRRRSGSTRAGTGPASRPRAARA